MAGNIGKRKKRAGRLRSFVTAGAAVCMILAGMTFAAVRMDRGISAGTADRPAAPQTVNATTETLDETVYPASLIELYENNPEAAQFVLDYPQNADRHEPIDISGDVTKGTVPMFLQWDERWGYELYGSDFMALTGCGPTCLSMVYCGLTGDTAWNPYKVAQKAEAEGYYVEGSGSSWDMMTTLAEELGLTAEEVIFDEEHILSELNAGRPVICIMGAGDFTTTGHFIVLTGVREDGTIAVHDPNSLINSSTGWELQRIMPQIRNLWSYR